MSESRSNYEPKYTPLEHAIEDFLQIKKEVEEKATKNPDLGKKIRARAREMPSYLEELGIVSLIAYCYGKQQGNEDYEIYLRYFIKELRRLGLTNSDDPVEVMKDLLYRQGMASKLVKPYLVHLKRLIEGFYEGG